MSTGFNLGLLASSKVDTAFPKTLSGNRLWLKAKTLVGADGSAVTSWADQSGKGNHPLGYSNITLATSATPNNGPAIRATSGAISLPSLGLGGGTFAATASSSYAGYWPYLAVNGVKTGENGWQASTSSDPQWFRVTPNAPLVATSYAMTPVLAIRSPSNFLFQGTLDGSNWVTLDSRTGVGGWVAGVTQTFSFSNSIAYVAYRIYITAHGGAETGFGEFEINGVTNTPPNSPSDGEMWIVVKSNTTSGSAWHFGTSGLANHYTFSGTVYDGFGTTDRYAAAPPQAVTSFRLYRVWVSGTKQYMSLNDAVFATNNITKAWSEMPMLLESSWSGDIAEVLIRGSISSLAERINLIKYFNNEHGLDVTIPILPIDGIWSGTDVFGAYPIQNLADQDPNTFWETNGSSNGTLYFAPTAGSVTVSTYKMVMRPGWYSRAIKSWVLQVSSNGGTNWTTIDTRSGVTYTTGSETYTLSSPATGNLFRINYDYSGGGLTSMGDILFMAP